jgi:hypothetical protein
VIVTFLALQSAGRVAAMLNYTAGPGSHPVSALSTARIRTVLASRAFIDKAGLEAVVAAIEKAGVTIVWLEDLRESIISWQEKRLRFPQMAQALARGQGKRSGRDPVHLRFGGHPQGRCAFPSQHSRQRGAGRKPVSTSPCGTSCSMCCRCSIPSG